MKKYENHTYKIISDFDFICKDVANYTDYYNKPLSDFLNYFLSFYEKIYSYEIGSKHVKIVEIYYSTTIIDTGLEQEKISFLEILELYKKCNKIIDFKLLENINDQQFNKFKEDLEIYNFKNKLEKELKEKEEQPRKKNKI